MGKASLSLLSAPHQPFKLLSPPPSWLAGVQLKAGRAGTCSGESFPELLKGATPFLDEGCPSIHSCKSFSRKGSLSGCHREAFILEGACFP